MEENRVLREQIGDRRMRFNDDQRGRLAAKESSMKKRARNRFKPVGVHTSTVGVASKIDRPEIRRECEPCARTTTNGCRDRCVGYSNGRGEIEPAPERSRQRLRGAFCRKHQGGVFGTDDSLRRRCVAEQHSRIPGPFSPRTQSSRLAKPIDQSDQRSRQQRRKDRTPRTTRRFAKLLLQGGVRIGLLLPTAAARSIGMLA